MLLTVILNCLLSSKPVFTRHLQRSGHMQSFVLVSEEAISKGIRRIVALTGPEALKAEKKCHLLEEQVEKIQNLVQEKMKNGSLNIKGTSQEIARLTEVRIISASDNNRRSKLNLGRPKLEFGSSQEKLDVWPRPKNLSDRFHLRGQQLCNFAGTKESFIS